MNENEKEKTVVEEKNVGEQQLVVFKVADEEFGVDINEVKEIIRWEEVTRIPNSEPYIKGVINLRGNIIVVNDLAMKLGLPSKEVDDDTRILVVEVGDNTVGMIVDSATEVLRLPGEKIREAPSMVTSGVDHNFIEGVGLLDEKRLLTLLDLSKVLESKEFQQIMATQHTAEKNIKSIKDVKSGEQESTTTEQSTTETSAKPTEKESEKKVSETTPNKKETTSKTDKTGETAEKKTEKKTKS